MKMNRALNWKQDDLGDARKTLQTKLVYVFSNFPCNLLVVTQKFCLHTFEISSHALPPGCLGIKSVKSYNLS